MSCNLLAPIPETCFCQERCGGRTLRDADIDPENINFEDEEDKEELNNLFKDSFGPVLPAAVTTQTSTRKIFSLTTRRSSIFFYDLESEATADEDKVDSNSESEADEAEKEEYQTTQMTTEMEMEPTKAIRNRVRFL